MADDKKKSIASQVSSDDEQPEIYGIKKGENGVVLNRRSFLGAIAASGVLAACGPASTGQCKDTPDALTKGCGSSKAHKDRVEGILMQDKLLFSWDANTLKAWEFTKGNLKKASTKDTLAENVKINADIFPELFLHIWEAPLLTHREDGTTLAINGQDGIALWKSNDKITTLQGAAQPVRSLAFHPGGFRPNSVFAAGSEDGSITVWSFTQQELQHKSIQGDSGPVLSLAFHPNDTLLLSGHRDGKVRIWQLPEGKAKQTLSCHDSSVLHMKITPNGALAVTAGEDGTIKLWSMPNGEPKNSLAVPPSEKITAMGISQNGQILATGTSEGHIYLWQLPEGKMMGCLFDPALTPKETQMGRYRQMGGQILTQACGKDLPVDATCVCDCVGKNLLYRTTQTVCTCDTIAVPAGYVNRSDVCVCNMVAVGSGGQKATPSCSCVGHMVRPGCSCVGHVTRGGGGHYWRPN